MSWKPPYGAVGGGPVSVAPAVCVWMFRYSATAAKPSLFPCADCKRAQVPAASGDARLVPPVTHGVHAPLAACPPQVSAPVSSDASIATSGRPRKSSVPALLTVCVCCSQYGGNSNWLKPPPPASHEFSPW